MRPPDAIAAALDTGAPEWVSDVRLTLANAMTFNGPEHPIHGMAVEMSGLLDKELEKLPGGTVDATSLASHRETSPLAASRLVYCPASRCADE
ncbi:hypothetical protein T484DRAFT_1822396 [Baffinella frigidus]|nr:hypothetical protein T484DRAFT_1822396 [Cryptophyta sp. CCMP2293]